MKDLLKKHKIRATKPRREIIKVIASLKLRHFSVEDILSFLKKTKVKVSRASAYRAVNLFSERKLLHPIDLGREFQIYELAKENENHGHLYCMSCGKIIEFQEKIIEELQIKVCKQIQFKPQGHTLKITGLCKECRK